MIALTPEGVAAVILAAFIILAAAIIKHINRGRRANIELMRRREEQRAAAKGGVR